MLDLWLRHLYETMRNRRRKSAFSRQKVEMTFIEKVIGACHKTALKHLPQDGAVATGAGSGWKEWKG